MSDGHRFAKASAPLVPRFRHQGYSADDVARRRAWVEEQTGAQLVHAGAGTIPTDELRGNIENPIGVAQVPLAVAGPLLMEGEYAQGIFYVPLATTEGALVRSYERGMVALTRNGGARCRLWADENRVAPAFFFDHGAAAHEFAQALKEDREVLAAVRRAAEATTGHGRLLRLEVHPLGREVIVAFSYSTGDAQGMNMIARATDAACAWLQERFGATRGGLRRYSLFSGYQGEKRAAGALLAGGKGKKVTAEARLERGALKAYLHTTPEEMAELWRHTVLGHLQAATLGYNGQLANGLTALFIACGQDVANIANAAVGITTFEVDPDGSLYASVTLPSLTVATVGGGTGLGTARECLAMLGCLDARGSGRDGARKLAEIAAATALAGELSMGAALASGEFVAAHEDYGRNRPPGHAPQEGDP